MLPSLENSSWKALWKMKHLRTSFITFSSHKHSSKSALSRQSPYIKQLTDALQDDHIFPTLFTTAKSRPSTNKHTHTHAFHPLPSKNQFMANLRFDKAFAGIVYHSKATYSRQHTFSIPFPPGKKM